MEVIPKMVWSTTDRHLLEEYPVVPAAAAIPAWFKAMPPNPSGLREGANARTCPGIVDLLTQGFIVPLWQDYTVEVFLGDRGLGINVFGSEDDPVSFFNEPQTAGLVPGTEATKAAIKFHSPWVVKTVPGWSTLFLPPPYAADLPITVLPGSVGTDTLHVFNVISTPNFQQGKVLIKAGTPICHAIPFHRTQTRLVLDLVDQAEWDYQQSAGKGAIKSGRRLIANPYRPASRRVNNRQRWASR